MTIVRPNRNTRTPVLSAMMAGISLFAFAAGAQAQTATSSSASAVVEVAIGAGPLEQALLTLAQQTNLQLVYPSALTRGKTSQGARGALSPQAALARILFDTGLEFQFTSPKAVVITPIAAEDQALPQASGDAVPLAPILLQSDQWAMTVYSPYETPGAVEYIDGNVLDRFPGSDAADLFRGTPSVSSGDARNNAGAVDVNIRGMQGMGRVAVTVDGTSNGIEVNQAYQGISARSYIDTDFVAGVDITKGGDMSSRGIAGSVALRTIEAGDIVQEGKKVGFKIKGGFSTNSSDPALDPDNPSNLPSAGYEFNNSPWGDTTPVASPDGMDRPGTFDPTGGNGSVIFAYDGDQLELLLGYSKRKRGNYHAGTNGPHVDPVNTGARDVCNFGSCRTVGNYWEAGGIANYRAGEEVLNTSLESKSVLAKVKWSFGDNQSVKLTYNGYLGEAGDSPSWLLQDNMSQATQSWAVTETDLKNASLEYRWAPADNSLVDLTATLWGTEMERTGPHFRAYGTGSPSYNKAIQINKQWGWDITNTSRLSTGLGELQLDAGLSYLAQDNAPADDPISQSDVDTSFGEKREYAAFLKGALEVSDRLTLNAGLRYLSYEIEDTRPDNPHFPAWPAREDAGWGHSLGVSYDVTDASTFYANYANALRSPSVSESTSSGPAGLAVPNELDGERNVSWELGVNHTRGGLFAAEDQAFVKLGYFNWEVDGYVAREFGDTPQGYSGLYLMNLDKAKFSGFELAGRYERGGFAADLAANYYTDVSFCKKGETCKNETLYGDYATNQIPPEYSLSLTLSQKLMQDRLTVGGRVLHVGPRAASHGTVTGQGLALFISQVKWDPYTTLDLFANYKFAENITGNLSIENVTDVYYVDPLGSAQQPAPGRTLNVSLTAHF